MPQRHWAGRYFFNLVLRLRNISKVLERNTKVENDSCETACTCRLGEPKEDGYLTTPVDVPVTCAEGDCTFTMSAGTVEINVIRTEGICRDKKGKGSFGVIPELDLEVSGKISTITPELVDNIKQFMQLQNR